MARWRREGRETAELFAVETQEFTSETSLDFEEREAPVRRETRDSMRPGAGGGEETVVIVGWLLWVAVVGCVGLGSIRLMWLGGRWKREERGRKVELERSEFKGLVT